MPINRVKDGGFEGQIIGDPIGVPWNSTGSTEALGTPDQLEGNVAARLELGASIEITSIFSLFPGVHMIYIPWRL
jgi:hypothetical protein